MYEIRIARNGNILVDDRHRNRLAVFDTRQKRFIYKIPQLTNQALQDIRYLVKRYL